MIFLHAGALNFKDIQSNFFISCGNQLRFVYTLHIYRFISYFIKYIHFTDLFNILAGQREKDCQIIMCVQLQKTH